MSRLPDPSSVGALAAVELVRVRLPLVVAFAAAHGTESVRDVVLVRALGTDGHEGWGECSALARPTYTAEHTDGAWNQLSRVLVPAVLGGRLESPPEHPMASAGVEAALVDLQLRRDGVRLVDAVGGTAERVASRAVLGGAASTDALVGAAASRLAAGHRSLKVKIAPGWDVVPLRALRDAFPAVALAADANGSYGLGDLDHLRSIGEVLGADAYLEQPLPAGDLDGSAVVAAALVSSVALDESIGSRAEAEAALSMGAGRVVNVKPARLGGIHAALDVARLLGAIGPPRRASGFVGGMLETGVGRAVALAVACHPALARAPADLGPSSAYFADDLTEPFELDDAGALTPPTGPGIGVTPRPDRLGETAVQRLLLKP